MNSPQPIRIILFLLIFTLAATNLCTAFPWDWGDDYPQSNDSSIPDYGNGTDGSSSEEMVIEIDFFFNLINSTNGTMANGTAGDYGGSSEELVEVDIIIEEEEYY
jgi:hypothetical protein